MKTEYFGDISLQVWEFSLLPFYFLIILLISGWIKNRNIRRRPEYRYYLFGLYAKLIGGLALAAIYLYHYKGGDTVAYFECAMAFANLFFNDPGSFMHVYFSPASVENLSFFNNTTGWPLRYMYMDPQTFTIIRFITPLVIVSFKSYFITTMLVAWISYFGIWNLFIMLCDYYKNLKFEMAIALLFIPSMVFWGSGILKDTFTFSAVCWFVYSFNNVVFFRKRLILNSVYLIVALYVILAIKPYIFMVLLPSIILWVSIDRILQIKNRLVVVLVVPIIYISSIGVGYGVLELLSGVLADYSLDNIVTKAVETQTDLKKDYYGGNAFDIGTIDASFTGILKKAPSAIVAGLFRPFIWEANNAVMAVSGLENLVMLLLLVWITVKVGLWKLIRFIFANPLMLFMLSFAVLFAFSVGLTTSNFGALVRFKIPLIPFFVSSLFILRYVSEKKRYQELMDELEHSRRSMKTS